MPARALEVTAVRWKPAGSSSGLVAVAHPDLQGGGQAGEQRRGGVFDGDFGVAVLALGRRAHLAAQVMDDEVQAVADAEHGHAEFEEPGSAAGASAS